MQPQEINSKQKSKKRWVFEWLGTGVVFVILAMLFLVNAALLAAPDTKDVLRIFYMLLLIVLVVSTFIVGITLIVRTIGILLMVIFPEKKAASVDFREDGITVVLENGNVHTYPVGEITFVSMGENFDGIYIAGQKKQSYATAQDSKFFEKSMDDAIARFQWKFKKKKQWIASNQRDLDPNKDSTGVKKDYAGIDNNGRPIERTVDAAHGMEVVSYQPLKI